MTAVLITVIVQLFFAVMNRETLATNGYLGPDSYMRMLRVEKLVRHGSWFDQTSDRTNAPYGEVPHWGRPLDAILAVAAAALSLFTDTRTAVYWAGAALGPLIALATIPIWSWGTRPFLSGGTYLMIFVLTPLSLAYCYNLNAARADHHGFIALLLIIQLCVTFRMATRRTGKHAAFLSGLAGGVMVWASVLTLLAQIVIALWLSIRLLKGQRGASRDIVLYLAGLTVTFTVALPLERDMAHLLAPDVNKVSFVHWVLAVAAASTWWGLDRHLRSRNAAPPLPARILVLLLGSGIPVAIVGVLFPAFLHGPTAHYDPEIVTFYFAHISELQPLLPTSLKRLANFAAYLGPMLVATCFLAWDYRKASDDTRSIYDVFLAGLAVYVPMSLWASRFSLYVEILALVPWAMACARLMCWTRTVEVLGHGVPIRSGAVIAAIAGPFVFAAVLTLALPRAEKTGPGPDWIEMARFLTDYGHRAGVNEYRPGILFTDMVRGPELAWRTPYSVVGAPYNNIDSLRDTRLIFGAEAAVQARRIVDRRGIDLILITFDGMENTIYGGGKDGTFLSRLQQGNLPAWLTRVSLPGDLSRQFGLFRVARGA